MSVKAGPVPQLRQTDQLHVGEQLVDRLLQYGISRVFGCPGGQTLPLYNGIARREGIEHVLMHDERSGAFAADAYARATGSVGVCDATVGPGTSNLVAGLAEAYTSSVPVLAIVSDIPRRWEHRRRYGDASQGFEQRHFLEPCVKWYGRVETAGTLADTLQACLRIATSGRPGPVVLEIPDDVFEGGVAEEPFEPDPQWARFPRLRAGADPAAVSDACALLRACRKPMVVVGGGAMHAGAFVEVAEMVDKLRCPIATTISGKGITAETHPLSVGVVGRFGVPMANELMEQADCVVFIGCKTGQSTTLGWTVPEADTPVIHIDVDPEEIGRNLRNTIGLLADARLGVAALNEALDDEHFENDWDLKEIGRQQCQWWQGEIEFKADPVPGVLKPQEITRAISGLMGDDDVLVTDASLSSGWGATRWQCRAAGRQFYAPRGMAGLGWGLPAAIGVAAARRDQGASGRTVLMAGDGGWGYSMTDVETAVRLELPAVMVVLNNSTLGWIKHSAQNRYPGEMVSQDFGEVSYAQAAAAMGADAIRVDTLDAFETAFVGALDLNTPSVIEAVSDDIETPVVPSKPGAGGGY